MVDLPPRPSPDLPVEEKREIPCHIFTKRFSPVMGMSQIQLLTNTLVRSTLPEPVLDKATENTSEEDERVKE